MRIIEVVAEIGEHVHLELARDIEAIVTAITIRDDGVSYELTWLQGGEVQTAWLPGMAIQRERCSKRIGFDKKGGS